jgi:hypothetical protein
MRISCDVFNKNEILYYKLQTNHLNLKQMKTITNKKYQFLNKVIFLIYSILICVSMEARIENLGKIQASLKETLNSNRRFIREQKKYIRTFEMAHHSNNITVSYCVNTFKFEQKNIKINKKFRNSSSQ